MYSSTGHLQLNRSFIRNNINLFRLTSTTLIRQSSGRHRRIIIGTLFRKDCKRTNKCTYMHRHIHIHSGNWQATYKPGASPSSKPSVGMFPTGIEERAHAHVLSGNWQATSRRSELCQKQRGWTSGKRWWTFTNSKLSLVLARYRLEFTLCFVRSTCVHIPCLESALIFSLPLGGAGAAAKLLAVPCGVWTNR